MLIVYINSQVVLLISLYMSLKMTAKSKIFAKDLVKKLAWSHVGSFGIDNLVTSMLLLFRELNLP